MLSEISPLPSQCKRPCTSVRKRKPWAFTWKFSQVELVKKRCLPGPGGLNLPMLEEYDFRNDRNTPDLNVSPGILLVWLWPRQHGPGFKRMC